MGVSRYLYVGPHLVVNGTMKEIVVSYRCEKCFINMMKSDKFCSQCGVPVEKFDKMNKQLFSLFDFINEFAPHLIDEYTSPEYTSSGSAFVMPNKSGIGKTYYLNDYDVLDVDAEVQNNDAYFQPLIDLLKVHNLSYKIKNGIVYYVS